MCIQIPMCKLAIFEDKKNDVYENCAFKYQTNGIRLGTANIVNTNKYKLFSHVTRKQHASSLLLANFVTFYTLDFNLEHMKWKKAYRNEVILRNLPTQNEFAFNVVVMFNSGETQKWSHLSLPSPTVNNLISNRNHAIDKIYLVICK